MRWWRAKKHPRPEPSFTFSQRMATRSKSRPAGPLEAAMRVSATAMQRPRGQTMFTKLIIAVAVSIAAAFFPATERYAVWIFFIAVVVAFVIEGVRIVPQQFAYVVERLGKFHAVPDRKSTRLDSSQGDTSY